MKRKVVYLPVALFIFIQVVDHGMRPSLWSLIIMFSWLWVGVKLTDREIPDSLGKSILYSWFWPVLLLKKGVYAHKAYQITLNEIPLGKLDSLQMKALLYSALRSPMTYVDQALQWLTALVVASIVAAILVSAIITLAAVGVGRWDGNLLVEIVRTWVDTGALPYGFLVYHVLKIMVIILVMNFSQNIFTDRMDTSIRKLFVEPAKGRIKVLADL